MAAPTPITTTGALGSSITSNANFPVTQNNDIVIESMHVTGTNPVATPAAGWTEISNVLYSTTARLITAWKRCAASEVDPVWTSVTGGSRYIISSQIRGCVTSGNPYDVLDEGQAASSASMSIAMGTTVYTDCLYLIHTGHPSNVTSDATSYGNLANGAEAYDLGFTGNSRKAYVGDLAVPGAAGTFAATLSAAAIQLWSLVALKSTTSVIPTEDTGNFFMVL